jgi:hypothetical protein
VDVVVKVIATIDGSRVTVARTKAELAAGLPKRLQLVPGATGRARLAGRTNVAAQITISGRHIGTSTSDKLVRDLRLVKSKR